MKFYVMLRVFVAEFQMDGAVSKGAAKQRRSFELINWRE